MILIDTSVWIDLLRGNGRGPELASMLRSDAPLASTEPVVMELLAGTRNEIEYSRVRRLGTPVSWLPHDPLLILIALRTECALMTSDRDFSAMKTLVPLQLV